MQNPSPTATYRWNVQNLNEPGTIAALADPVQGTELSAPTITHPDSPRTPVTVTAWEWQQFDDTSDNSPTVLAATETYTPVAADVGKVLKLKVPTQTGTGQANRPPPFALAAAARRRIFCPPQPAGYDRGAIPPLM